MKSFWLKIAALVFLAILMPGAAMAQDAESCRDRIFIYGGNQANCSLMGEETGPIPNWEERGAPCGEGGAYVAPAQMGMDQRVVVRLFSSVTCRVKNILQDVTAEMWCFVSDGLSRPLSALLTLYVAITAIFFVMGLVPMSGKEVIMRSIKIIAVWQFATNGEYAIGLAYNFFVTAATEGISIVLHTVDATNPSDATMMDRIDEVFSAIYLGRENSGSLGVEKFLGPIGFAVGQAMANPFGIAIGGFFMLSVFYSFFVFAKAVLAYLLAIAGIAFLTALSPLFISMALFQKTSHLFNKWLESLISYTLQPIILFAFLILMEQYIFGQFDFLNCSNLRVIEAEITPSDGDPNSNANEGPGSGGIYTFVQRYIFNTSAPCDPASGNCDAVSWGARYENMAPQTRQLIISVFGVLILIMVTDSFLANVPSFAQQLAGLSAPVLGGTANKDYKADLVGFNSMDSLMADYRKRSGDAFATSYGENSFIRTNPTSGVPEFNSGIFESYTRNDLIESALTLDYNNNPSRAQEFIDFGLALRGGPDTGAKLD